MALPALEIWLRNSALCGAVCGALGLVSSCRGATQITLHVRTNVPCTEEGEWQGVAVYVGTPGAGVEHTSATLVTRSCDENGNVGSLVVVPSDEKDGEVGLRVVAGITKNPEECAADGYAGCIVARRAVRFSPHDALELDVELDADCVSIGCDPERTCLTGGCVESRALELAPAAPQVSGPSVRCGDNGAVCATSGDVCCLSVNAEAGTTQGDCRPAKNCPPTSIVLNCDDDTDCPGPDENGVAGICALSYTHDPDLHWTPNHVALSDCRFAHNASIAGNLGLALCQERKSCANGAFPCQASLGAPNQLPGYFWCQLIVP